MQHDKHKDRTTPQPAQTERATQFVDKLAGDVAELQELITSARAIINKAGNPETPKDTTISLEQWHDFYEWLVVDRKIKATTHHRDTTTSRYRKLCNFLSGRPLTRESFNEFISHMKDNGYSNNYMNNLIKLAKLLDRYHGINQL